MTTIKNRLLTIIMPVYNGMPYLKYAVQSILKQTFNDFQLIIVNDGSTDETSSYLNSLKHSKIKVIHKQHSGIIESFNYLLKDITSKYIARVDADDYYYPTKFEKQISFLEKHTNIVAVGTRGYYMSAKGEISKIKINVPKNHDEIILHLFNKKRAILQPSLVVYSKIIKKISGYRDNIYPEDYDLYFRLGLEGNLANIMEELVAVRIHKSYSSEKLESLINNLDKIIGFYSKNYDFPIKDNDNTTLTKSILFNRKAIEEYLNGSKLIAIKFLLKGFVLSPNRLVELLKKNL